MRNAAKLFASAVLLMVSSSVRCRSGEILVYMREDPAAGKQIWQVGADGSGAKAITSGDAWHLYPAISPDGSQLAYVEGTGKQDLAVVLRRVGAQALEQWTHAGGQYLQADFSGDGRLLAFTGPVGPYGEDRIGIIDVAAARSKLPPLALVAGPERRLFYDLKARVVESDEKSYFPALSSDGSFIVFHRSKSEEVKDIVEVDLRSGRTKQLTPPDGKCMAPALSFDDRYVVHTCFVDGNWDVYVTDRASGRRRRVTTDPGKDFAPTFLPSGDVVFASDRDGGHFQLYRAEVRSFDQPEFRERLLLAGGGGDLYAPTSSGDLAYVQGELPSLPAPARSSFGVVEHQGKIYVAGGHRGPEHTYTAESFVDRFEVFDLATARWSELPPRRTPSQGFDLVARGDYIYAFGGFAHDPSRKPAWQSLDVIERYSITAKKWEVIGRMPRPRSSYAAAQLGDKVYLFGGWDATPRHEGDEEGHFYREIDAFDLKTEAMTQAPYLLPDPLRRAFTALVHDGRVLLCGGLGVGSSHFSLLNQVTQFDPATGEWREFPKLPFPTFAPAAGAIGSDLYALGGLLRTGQGSTDSAYVNHIFVLRPGADHWEHTGRYLKETKGFARVVATRPDGFGLLGGHTRTGSEDAPVGTFETFGRRQDR